MKEKIEKIFTILEKANPTPKTELNYTNNYTLLLAVVLSAQATDKGVNIATKELFEKYDTPEKILELGLDGLKQYIKTINYYHTKAKNIIGLSEILINKYNSKVPDKIEELMELPGVGRKTANVVLSAAFNHASMPVDTHVFRVAKRLGIAVSNNHEKVEQELLKNIAEKWLINGHNWLVLHGRYICKAKNPLCDLCIIRDYCNYFKELNYGKK